ncbi:hypothetical protein C8Q74DRAFT_498482 [Fomes fomentarius]|nr:hypothetical protein C8Q74DRAFT_498482 [Fomes fomentarius]
MSPTVFVTGPTGTMGGAAAHEFLRRGWAVRATIRDDTTPVAAALKAAGAVLVRGDWDDEAALKQALHGCTAVFLNLLSDFKDFTSERRHGQAILDLARHARRLLVRLGRAQPALRSHNWHAWGASARRPWRPCSTTSPHSMPRRGPTATAVSPNGPTRSCAPAGFMANLLEPQSALLRRPAPAQTGARVDDGAEARTRCCRWWTSATWLRSRLRRSKTPSILAGGRSRSCRRSRSWGALRGASWRSGFCRMRSCRARCRRTGC